MKRLCLFIPTRNHPDLMQFYLEQTVDAAKELSVDIWIDDTSDNDDTAKIAAKYDCSSVFYSHQREYPDKTTDLKVKNGFQKLMDQYDYIWLCGDGYVPELSKVMPLIAQYIESETSMIHFIDKIHMDNSLEMDALFFFRTYGWYVTYYGATIVSSALMRNVDFDEQYEKWRNSGFLFWSCVFTALAEQYKTITVLDSSITYINNPFKNSNSSFRPNGFARFWFQKWPEVVYSLPKMYDQDKETVCKMLGTKIRLYDWRGLMKLRLSGNLTYSIIRDNLNNIPK